MPYHALLAIDGRKWSHTVWRGVFKYRLNGIFGNIAIGMALALFFVLPIKYVRWNNILPAKCNQDIFSANLVVYSIIHGLFGYGKRPGLRSNTNKNGRRLLMLMLTLGYVYVLYTIYCIPYTSQFSFSNLAIIISNNESQKKIFTTRTLQKVHPTHNYVNKNNKKGTNRTKQESGQKNYTA